MIATDKLTKRYRDVVAVSELSLHVRRGEIYGFLGLNGAGKTTTIRMLLGMINPNDGHAFINGKKVHPNNTDLWKEIGYLVEMPYSYPNLTVKENLEIVRRLRFIDNKNAVNEIIGKMKLNQYANRKAKNLSLGNAQRLGVAKAMIHNPSLLILDEPANGFDPEGIYEIRELLTDMAQNQGVTIFISSHILGEISKFANRIGIIHNGELIRELDSRQLEKLCQKRLMLDTINNAEAMKILYNHGFIPTETPSQQIEIVDTRAIVHPETIAKLMVENHTTPTMLNVVEEDLESYFLRTIKEKGE